MIDVDKAIRDLELLNEGFEWTVKEASNIHNKINLAYEDGDFDKVNLLRDKFIELEDRHEYNRKIYNGLLKNCKGYFLEKYGLDISKYFNF